MTESAARPDFLPDGPVTFLLTDIEGSARLWERDPQSMSAALARHDSLAAEVIERHRGVLIKSRGEGDSLFAVFPRSADAVAAAFVLQTLLSSESWPSTTPIRVRSALHTGKAELREGDFYGSAVNRCARLRAIAHGGQILISNSTREACGKTLPQDVMLKDMGRHRLKDLQQPEHVWQLLHRKLPGDFPPLRSLGTFPNNLPQQTTSFVGREKQVADVRVLLRTARLITLTGSGGVGKTRLALSVAAELLEEFDDGIWLVELASLSDSILVPQTLATVLAVREQPGQALETTMIEFLRDKRMLLVLDNCEHLLGACAQLADLLVRSCPRITVLASSREALGVTGEVPYRVPSLTLPDPARLPPIETLEICEAIRLFVERARLYSPNFALTAVNAGAVAHACHRLDGIPLAIELAAARLRAIPVEQLAARLDDRFRLLTGGSRTALPRHQTLRALIDWSYGLLGESERLLFRRISVFVGGWTLEAAEAVCRWGTGGSFGSGEDDPLDLLTSLVDKSLVLYEGHDGFARYSLLETVRQYARERLLESGEGESVRRGHRDWFLRMTEEGASHLRGPDQAAWLNHLAQEHDNLRAALEWCCADAEGELPGLRLAGALGRFWHVRGHLSEGRERLAAALSHPSRERRKPRVDGSVDVAVAYSEASRAEEGVSEGDPELGAARARALGAAGTLARSQGDFTAAGALFEQARAICQALGDKEGVASMKNSLGLVAAEQGDYATAQAFYEQSLALSRELGDRRTVAATLGNLGIVAFDRGDYALARELYQESLSMRREEGDSQGIATALNNLGNVAYEEGDFAEARRLQSESLKIRRELGDRWGIAASLNNLAIFAWSEGDLEAARRLDEESLAIRREIGDRQGVAASLHNLGTVAFDRGDLDEARRLSVESLTLRIRLGERSTIIASLEAVACLDAVQDRPASAARLLGAAEALREAVGAALPPPERARCDRHVAVARAALGEEAFAAAWSEGRQLTMEAACEQALSP